MRRSLLSPTLVFLLAFLVLLAGGAGCGGGGGGSSSNGGNNGGSTGVAALTLVGTASGSDVTRSLANTVAGEQIVLRALVRDSSGVASFVPLSNVEFNVPAGVATYDPATNTITAVTPSGETYTIRGTANGTTVTAPFHVDDARAGVSGIVRTESGTGVPGTQVKFLSASGSTVATAPVGPTGRFQANLPATATMFVIDVTSVNTRFYNQFGYGALDYSAGVEGCGAPLPSLTVGTTTPLPNDAVLYAHSASSPPPPPPSGCAAGN